MTDFDILVAGEINPDLILSGNVVPVFGQVEKLVTQARLAIGSSAAIFACGAARLGLRVGFIGVCGEDVFGRFMLEQMGKRSVDVKNVIRIQDGETGLSVILNRGTDRAILTFPGLIGALTEGDIPDDLLRRTRHLHVASYFLQTLLQPSLPQLFARAHHFNASTSLDTNWDPAGEWTRVRELLPLVDVFLPNGAEARAITGLDDTVQTALVLARYAGTAAVKLGSDGAVGAQGERVVRSPALAVHVEDTVGAGDSFDAGFLCGYLNGWDLEDSLHLGAICGSLSTRSAGGTDAQPNLGEARSYLKIYGQKPMN
jgi:sugar/nucleoside kinase (ribokinase family)